MVIESFSLFHLQTKHFVCTVFSPLYLHRRHVDIVFIYLIISKGLKKNSPRSSSIGPVSSTQMSEHKKTSLHRFQYMHAHIFKLDSVWFDHTTNQQRYRDLPHTIWFKRRWRPRKNLSETPKKSSKIFTEHNHIIYYTSRFLTSFFPLHHAMLQHQPGPYPLSLLPFGIPIGTQRFFVIFTRRWEWIWRKRGQWLLEFFTGLCRE